MMKLKLNERQFNIIESLLNESSVLYGLENILTNITVGDTIIISTIEEIGVGKTVDLSDNTNKYKITRINGNNLSLQNISNKNSAVVNFSEFDKGILSSGPTKFNISNITLLSNNLIVKPKTQDPELQSNKIKSELDSIKVEFINTIKSVGRNENLVLKGKTDYEFKVINYDSKKVNLKPISSEIKGDGLVTIPFNTIEYDSKENSFKLKYNDSENSYSLDGISGAESRESIESEELVNFKDTIRKAQVDDLIKMNNISLELIKADQGSPLMTVPYDDKTSDFFQKHTPDEIGPDFKVLINIGTIDEKDSKIAVTFEIIYNGNERYRFRAFPTNIEVEDIGIKNKEEKRIQDKKNQDDTEKADSDRLNKLKNDIDKERKTDKRKRERDKEKQERERRVMDKIKTNPILIRAIKKGILPADELLRKIYNKAYSKKSNKDGEKTNTWTDNFINRSKVRFKLLSDSFELVGKDHSPSFEFGETYVARVFEKTDKTVSLKTKDYKVLIDNNIGGDEYNCTIYVFKDYNQKDIKRVEIKIEEYNA